MVNIKSGTAVLNLTGKKRITNRIKALVNFFTNNYYLLLTVMVLMKKVGDAKGVFAPGTPQEAY